MSTAALMAALRARYNEEGYAMLTEVANATGGRISRFADALVMSTWPSRGLTLSGFEVKASRGDWIKELREPAKAEAIARYCDYWWLVVTDETVAKRDEVPETWGFMVLRKDTLVAIKAAEKMEAKPFDRNFLAAVLRRATQQLVPKDETDAMAERRYREGIKEGERRGNTDAERFGKELKILKDAITAFETASGIPFQHYNMGQVGKELQLLREVRHQGSSHAFLQQLEARKWAIKSEAMALDAALLTFKANMPATADTQPPQ
jgi:hypothetical protein